MQPDALSSYDMPPADEPLKIALRDRPDDFRVESIMTAKLIRFAKDNSGATAVEYAALALAIALAVSQLGTSLNALYESVGAAFPSK